MLNIYTKRIERNVANGNSILRKSEIWIQLIEVIMKMHASYVFTKFILVDFNAVSQIQNKLFTVWRWSNAYEILLCLSLCHCFLVSALLIFLSQSTASHYRFNKPNILRLDTSVNSKTNKLAVINSISNAGKCCWIVHFPRPRILLVACRITNNVLT